MIRAGNFPVMLPRRMTEASAAWIAKSKIFDFCAGYRGVVCVLHRRLLNTQNSDAAPWPRRRFLKLLGAIAVAPAFSSHAFAAPRSRQLSSVLILGDSMSLCGFGSRLDERFRKCGVNSVNTYMACGTHPLSWTTQPAYAKAQSRCGYWKIETPQRGGAPVTFRDTYGMPGAKRGHRPEHYEVPKIEDLLPAMQPEILVVQLGNNLFDLLKGREKSGNGAVLEPFITPFLAKVANSSVRRVYWVAPPVSGLVPQHTQDILVERLRLCGGRGMRVIDSRELLTYPYSKLQPDKQHFLDPDMRIWADNVFALIEEDMESAPPTAVETPLVAQEGEDAASGESDRTLLVQCSLERINAPFRHEEIAPYHDSLVAFVYRVQQVLKGDFHGTHLVVLHAAHIAGKRQSMHQFSLGQSRILRLRPVEQTPWATLKAKDDPRFLELERYINEEDHAKLARHL